MPPETVFLRTSGAHGAVVPNFTERTLNNEPMVIARDGNQWQRFVYVEDLAEVNVLAIGPVADNRIYNLDGQERVTIRRVAETIRNIVGRGDIRYEAARTGDLRGKEAVSARAKRELGWQPRITFRIGP